MTAGTPKRSLGLGDVLGLGINCVIGSGIFLLPGPVSEGLGPASLLAVLLAGGLAFLIALCFAEAATRVDATGGAHAYAAAAFGPATGFVVGWTATLAGTVAWAALVNAWAIALGALVPAAGEGLGRLLAMLGLLAALGLANARGAVLGSGVSKALSAIKVTTLVGFVVAGAFFVDAARFTPFAPHGLGELGGGVLLMLYAFVGFENLVVPAGEMRRPERAVPLAITAIMAAVTALYIMVQAVTVGTLDDPAGHQSAVADAAGAFLGPAGGTVAALAVLISILGVNAASALVMPRRLYALSDLGPMPAALGRLHPVYRTPATAIAVSYGLVAAVALSGSFRELAIIAVVARFLQYAPTCLAVLVFRRRAAGTATPTTAVGGFRLPLGPAVPIAALALSALLLTRAAPHQLLAGLAVAASGVPVYMLLDRRRKR